MNRVESCPMFIGTGFRNRRSLANLSLKIGGQDTPPDFADAQGTFPGLDQMNVPLARKLAGRDLVDVVFLAGDPEETPSQTSNIVQIRFK